MTHVTCRLTVKNRDQLRNPTLGNRVWAIFDVLALEKSGFSTDRMKAVFGFAEALVLRGAAEAVPEETLAHLCPS